MTCYMRNRVQVEAVEVNVLLDLEESLRDSLTVYIVVISDKLNPYLISR